MRKILIALVVTTVPPAGTSMAWATSPCAHTGLTRDVICVCNKRYCWLEPGTRYRFEALFGDARALTASGAQGVWRPVRGSTYYTVK